MLLIHLGALLFKTLVGVIYVDLAEGIQVGGLHDANKRLLKPCEPVQAGYLLPDDPADDLYQTRALKPSEGIANRLAAQPCRGL